MDASVLASIPLFSGLEGDDLARCAERCEEVEVIAGTKLAEAGDFGYKFFAILDGSVEVRRDGEVVADLGPGDVFGEAALIDAGRRNAHVMATTRVRAAQMMIWDYRALLAEVPDLAERIDELMAERA